DTASRPHCWRSCFVRAATTCATSTPGQTSSPASAPASWGGTPSPRGPGPGRTRRVRTTRGSSRRCHLRTIPMPLTFATCPTRPPAGEPAPLDAKPGNAPSLERHARLRARGAPLPQSQLRARESLTAEEDYIVSPLRLLGERPLGGPRLFNDTTGSYTSTQV